MQKKKFNRKQLVNKVYKCPPIQIICPTKMLDQAKKSHLIINHQFTDSNDKHNQEEKKSFTKSQWNSQFKSSQFQSQKPSTGLKKSQFSVKKKISAEMKRSVCNQSPYVKNRKDFQRILSLLKPVKGPTQSLIGQIRKHNDQNRKNAENVILNRKESFKAKIMKFSSRLGLNQKNKIFVMNSKDSHIRQILQENGWVESLDKDTTFFHLRWVYNDSPSDYNKLQSSFYLIEDGQFFNHFKNNQELTNKNLLRKNIAKAKIKPNFPQTFDLQLSEDLILFKKQLEKFQYFKVLDSLVQLIKSEMGPYYERILNNKNYFSHKKIKQKTIKKKSSFQLLSSNGFNQINLKESLYYFCAYFCQNLPQLQDVNYSIFEKYPNKSYQTLYLLKENIAKKDQLLHILSKQDKFITVQIVKIHKRIHETWETTFGIQNAWIIKPAGVSRGSGITIENDPHKIFQNKYGKIVQKYIEKPLILQCGRKFDIRQWVLVKSFNPLEAYVFENCYCRFSSEKYSNDKYSNLKKHLTNYSQQKDAFSKTFSNWNSILSEENLASQIGQKWKEIKKQININILKTLKACQQEIISKPECFQVYGFDIIIDSAYKPWILQVNLSPACEKRSEFIVEYLRKMSYGILDLIQDRQIQYWQPLQSNYQFVQMSEAIDIKEAQEGKMEKLKTLIAVTKIQKAWRNSVKGKASPGKDDQEEKMDGADEKIDENEEREGAEAEKQSGL